MRLYLPLARQPIVIIGVDKTAEAAGALKKNWVHMFGQEIYSL